MFEGIDVGASLDLVAKALGAATAVIAIVTALTQITLPSALRRREKWMREALAAETNKRRRILLEENLGIVTARIIGGMLVPGWRFVEPLWVMLLGAAQYYVWNRGTPDVWDLVWGFLGAVIVVTIPLRRVIRLLCERARVVHEYREGKSEIRAPRLRLLSQMEGGTRSEFLNALIASLAINLLATGVALLFLDLEVPGIIAVCVGIGGIALMWGVIAGYIRRRIDIYGPWSTKDEKF